MSENLVLEYVVEKKKLASDYIKHLTTLSTGSIILLTAFLEKLFVQPRWKPLVIISLCGFMLSVVASVIAYTALLHGFPTSEAKLKKPSRSDEILWALSVIATWTGFLIGIISLTVFAMKNFLQ